MRNGKLILAVLTAFLIAAAAFFGLQEAEQIDGPISVILFSDGAEEEISCWQEESTGQLFLFLPSYADLSQAQLRTDHSSSVYLDGQLLTDGMTGDVLKLDQTFTLTQTKQDMSCSYSLTVMQSGNVPAMYIDVTSGNMDYIHQKYGNSETGSIRLYTADGQLDHSGKLESVEGRGNSTWTLPKKPYNIKLELEADLLGMGQAKNWILLANAYDASHIRNKLVLDFADAAGLPYTPEAQWVDLYLNGEYAGLYLLCERNEVHSERVDISEEDGFLVSYSSEYQITRKGQPHICLHSGTFLRILSSSYNEDKLFGIWQSAEDAILAEDGIDPLTGLHWTELIDLDSWAAKYLIEEVVGSCDVLGYSQFFYLDGSDGTGKIHAGPVWDYDRALGNPNTSAYVRPNMLYTNVPSQSDTSWYPALSQKTEFMDRVSELYQTTFLPLAQELLRSGISSYLDHIAQAASLDWIRWKNDISNYAESADSAAEGLRSYLTERLNLLSSMWLEGETYCLVEMTDMRFCYAIRPGEILPEIQDYTDTEDTVYLGWYRTDTDEPFDETQPVFEDVAIYMKKMSVTPAAAEGKDDDVQEERALGQYAFAIIFVCLLAAVCLADLLRNKRMKNKDHDRNKHHEISSRAEI